MTNAAHECVRAVDGHHAVSRQAALGRARQALPVLHGPEHRRALAPRHCGAHSPVRSQVRPFLPLASPDDWPYGVLLVLNQKGLACNSTGCTGTAPVHSTGTAAASASSASSPTQRCCHRPMVRRDSVASMASDTSHDSAQSLDDTPRPSGMSDDGASSREASGHVPLTSTSVSLPCVVMCRQVNDAAGA